MSMRFTIVSLNGAIRESRFVMEKANMRVMKTVTGFVLHNIRQRGKAALPELLELLLK
ncbi:MAG: Unknown protein [uncultured Thiotrichaceae bacterium]|uniref:Uncharacterized protein n=1 Tax=uncultured Thiotrichaceae bacterium TaxID=298394 RepID=A0A6S6TV92_9GAMM|nr:MAG: Unknown protein [uncultured Thiotrichaceae bacterium]